MGSFMRSHNALRLQSAKVEPRKNNAKGFAPPLKLKSRSKRYRARKLHEKLKQGKPAPQERKPREPRVEPKYVPVYPEKHRSASRRSVQKPTKVRASLKPGAVLILLAGKYQAKRVVLLGVLDSGLLLVTGPYKINGVPLRRVNAAYVIATSTTVDVSGIKIKDELKTDAFFRAPSVKKEKKDAKDAFFASGKSKKQPLSAEFLAAQKEIDTKIIEAVKKVPLLAAYLRTPFRLDRGQFPHQMKF